MGLFDLFRSSGPAAPAPAKSQTNSTELLNACYSSDTATIERLLRSGVSPNCSEPDFFSGGSRNALTIAVGNSDLRSTSLLLRYGADPNSRNETAGSAIALACGHGCLEIVRELLNHKAAVNSKDADGWTPLMFAVSSFSINPAIVVLLLQAGADVNAVANDGTTVLMAAARIGHPGVIQALLDRRCPLNGRDKDGDTALSIAQKQGHHNAARLLRAAGAK